MTILLYYGCEDERILRVMVGKDWFHGIHIDDSFFQKASLLTS
jgi:hypothetical protein